MKKGILILAALIALTANAQPHHVDASQARQLASNFWLWHNTTPTRGAAWNIKQLVFESLDQLHIFDFNGTGFVIVPADDRVMPVLAYSFTDPFPAELNPELGYWLRGYNAQIAAVGKSALPRNSQWDRPLLDPEPDSTVDLTGVPAMLTTKWNQNNPYNKFCPYDSSEHSRTVVGCVATAMAQIMKYWNYPAYGEGSHSYTPTQWHSSYDFGTLTADFGNTTYLWEYMPDELDQLARTFQRDAVARLSYHCGVAVDMMYGTSSQGGSGAYTSCGNWASACATNAFWQYFKYDTSLYFASRDHTGNDSLWRALIDEQLAQGHPLYYDGSDTSGGHAFVLDGSDTNGRYHFNWGWGGSGDGFYTIDNLAPGSGGDGGNATYTFNHSQGAIFGIKPAHEETFDTADYYDTVCSNNQFTTFYEYTLRVSNIDTTLRHLGTFYRYHLKVIPSNRVYLNPNISGEIPISVEFCSTSDFVFPRCTFEKEGHVFAGWCRVKTGDDTIYQPGQSVRLNASTTFFAIWTDTSTAAILNPEDENIALWPNPTTGELFITLSTGHDAQLFVIDAMGRTVLRENYPNAMNGTAKISLQGLPSGTYTVQIKTATGIYNKRIIKL